MVDWHRQTRGALMPLGLFLSQLFGKKEDSPELTESPESPDSSDSPESPDSPKSPYSKESPDSHMFSLLL